MDRKRKINAILKVLVGLKITTFQYQDRQSYSIIFIQRINMEQINEVVRNCDKLGINYLVNEEGFAITIGKV